MSEKKKYVVVHGRLMANGGAKVHGDVVEMTEEEKRQTDPTSSILMSADLFEKQKKADEAAKALADAKAKEAKASEQKAPIAKDGK